MTSPSPIDARLDDLEIKASFTEDLLEELNLALFRQQRQIDRLAAQVEQLKEQAARQSPSAGAAAARDPRDELPPHY